MLVASLMKKLYIISNVSGLGITYFLKIIKFKYMETRKLLAPAELNLITFTV